MKTKTNLLLLLAVALALPALTMFVAKAAVAGRTAPPRLPGPCDLYAAGGTPCVAAHSTTRALSATYNGPLYQVQRQSDGKTLDIGVVPPSALPTPNAGGYADAAAQDAFCANTLCFITRIYDQSGKGNHLLQAAPGTFLGPAKGGFDTLPIADMAPISIGGRKAYGVFIMPGMGLRANNATGVAINDEPEGIYYVIDGTHYDSGCCFDYGNASTNGRAVGTGTMETTYFGTSTAWGSGAGPGPWIMSDMEAGLFSGYNAKQNPGSPTIDQWRFVTAVVDGGGGNQWDLRGGNAQQGGLTTFYSGPRPGTPGSNAYFPMHKKGGVLLGNGGDNGNGSAGTFYEGVMTTGYPTEATTDAVQANIVAAKYDVPQVRLSSLTTLLFSSRQLVSATFTPGSTQDLAVSFTNTTDEPATDVKLSVTLPGWVPVAAGTKASLKMFTEPVAPGASVSVTFEVTAPSAAAAGFLVGKAEWTNSATRLTRSETQTARVRSAFPVKINEVLLGNGASPTSQFIELYNAGASEVDISNWKLIHTPSQWAPVRLAEIPRGTKLAAHGFYLLGLATSGLIVPPARGSTSIHVRSTTDLTAGQAIELGGARYTIMRVGTPAAPLTTLFIPVSTGPWLTIPAGSTNVPVTSVAGFVVGEKMAIAVEGNLEVATVTAVGKAATQTTLTGATAKGATSLALAVVANLTAGDKLTIDTGGRKELAMVKTVTALVAGAASAAAPGGRGGGRGAGGGGTVELAAPLQLDHMTGIDVSSPGTGISFSPATYYSHTSGEEVQALGSGLVLDRPVLNGPDIVVTPATEGFQGPPAPNQWFGVVLSSRAGSIALMDATDQVVVDAMVYGSQQGNSSANGTITSPELATLEGDQGKGGCIVVVPAAPRGGRGRGATAAAPAAPTPGRSAGRTSDGADTDSNCADFQLQTPTPGAPNQKLP